MSLQLQLQLELQPRLQQQLSVAQCASTVANATHSAWFLYYFICDISSCCFDSSRGRYFHCNFGQHILLFDRLGGTLREEARVYGEAVFGGRGSTAVLNAVPGPGSAKKAAACHDDKKAA